MTSADDIFRDVGASFKVRHAVKGRRTKTAKQEDDPPPPPAETPPIAQGTLAGCEQLGYGAAAETVAFFCGGGLDLTSGQVRASETTLPAIVGSCIPEIVVVGGDVLWEIIPTRPNVHTSALSPFVVAYR